MRRRVDQILLLVALAVMAVGTAVLVRGIWVLLSRLAAGLDTW